MFFRGLSRSGRCQNGCNCLESPCHLFCDCPIFEAYRVIPSLLSDNSALSWPHGWNRWFLGHTLLLKRDFPSLPDRVAIALSHIWHVAFIHLAGHIWGHVQRAAGGGLVHCRF
ncbi:uncharacterized protein EI90DRAFT_3257613 [Cantharellus anzutake]|uniref:uncharacterized protein n=1 Tax=Cantharellus anzutake TaxID=1750568 RepID=UPI001905955D|nr:uncharacterized protein EI90DRAFT_3257613 [Cantharellus anzutake]KAF8318610.1 hypothetical protein EI90DRAFT_3257613 [Cantharellus anzutake]